MLIVKVVHSGTQQGTILKNKDWNGVLSRQPTANGKFGITELLHFFLVNIGLGQVMDFQVQARISGVRGVH
jgi:hypothetical protein